MDRQRGQKSDGHEYDYQPDADPFILQRIGVDHAARSIRGKFDLIKRAQQPAQQQAGREAADVPPVIDRGDAQAVDHVDGRDKQQIIQARVKRLSEIV